MNTILKIGVAGALALGYASAHASIAQPSTGSSDMILFAEVISGFNTPGQSVVASYAGDTGISVAAATSGTLTSQTVLAGDANLAALFAADASGDTILWSVQGGAFTGLTSAPNFGKKGNAEFVANGSALGAVGLSTLTVTNFSKWGALNTDVATLNTNFNGANSVEGSNPATAGIFDVTASINLFNWYGTLSGAQETLGATDSLFGVTGNGGPSSKVLTTNLGSVDLTAGGLVITGNNAVSAVPLPAAVWLLGSGLLGLAGIGRRKATNA